MRLSRPTIAATLIAVALPATAAAATSIRVVRTAQTKPLVLKGGAVRSVVGHAAITDRGGLVIRLLGPSDTGATGEVVLAQVRRRIPDVVSAPTRSDLKIMLRRDHTGEVQVLGPRNAKEPDSVAYTFAWKVSPHASLRIIHVGT